MSNLLSLLGWTFLPGLVTGWVQTIYYGIAIRAGDPKPKPGSPRFNEHRRRIHILVVSLYLMYTIYEADFELRRAGSFYTDLGVPLNASERDIKSRFRRLAALYHPDKVVGGSTDAGEANTYFVHLKTASDTLLDGPRRFAYERFGPDVVGWERCKTVRDFVLRGMQVVVPYYGAAAAVMYGLGWFGYLAWGRYERWLVLAGMLVFELLAATRPSPPWLLSRVVGPALAAFGRPPYLPFQAVAIARKLSVTLYIAFSQIGPLLAAGSVAAAGKKGADADAQLRENLDRLEATAKSIDTDMSRMVDFELTPFQGDPEIQATMRGKMKEWLVQNTIRSDPMVRDALGRSLQRRRPDAPAGARGTK